MRGSILALVVMLMAGSAQAQSDQNQIRRGPAPAWAKPSEPMPVPEQVGGPAFMRRQDIVVHLSPEGQAQYVGFRVKILQPSALQLGNVTVAWNPRASAPIVHQIRVIRGDQTIDVLKDSSFEILRRESQLERSMLDGTLTGVLRVPDLRVGDELEVEATTFGNDPTMGGHDAGLLALTASPAPGRYRMGFNWDPVRKPLLRMTDDIKATAVSGERSVDLRFDNPTMVNPPKDAPFRYRWRRVLEFTDFADWTAVSRHFAPLYRTAAKLEANSPIKVEAQRIGQANAAPLDRAREVLKLVQQNVRYIYVGLNAGNLTPAAADETWRRRYGDCKGKTTLLLALLNELGIEAEPVLVNSAGLDDGLNEHLPIPQFFDHVLVRARIDGRTYWLDGTLPAVAEPSEEPVIPLRWVLPLSDRGAALEKLEWRAPTTPDEVHLYEIDARDGFDKPARIVTTEILRGVEGLKQQAQLSLLTHDQLLTAMQQTSVGRIWTSIDDVTWRYDVKMRASIITISGKGEADWDTDEGGGKSMALPGGGFTPPDRRVRGEGQDKSVPFYTKPAFRCFVTTVRVPTTSQAKQWSSRGGVNDTLFGKRYYRAWEFRDGAIRMVSSGLVEQPEIDPAAAERDNARIAAFDNIMAMIYFRPASQSGRIGQGTKVPATYELDWASDDAACRPPPVAGR